MSHANAAIFARGKAPRALRGTAVAEGIVKVELRLTRRAGDRCHTFSDQTESWKAMRRCGAERGTWFAIGSGSAWSYLLPGALTAGRYVFDVRVTDSIGNRSTLARGSTRNVFHVR
jgi:hypothetical protein